MILELRDKLRLEDALEHLASENEVQGAAAYQGEVQSDAVQALVALGYGSTEALKAVRQVDITENMEVEEVLKQALKADDVLMRGGIDEQTNYYNREPGRGHQN